MTLVADFARLIEAMCNDECIVEERGGPVAHGMQLDVHMFHVLTPTCSLVEREQLLAALPMWAQRQIERGAAEAEERQQRLRRPQGAARR